ncbi:MAG TPA: aminotransferase class V-fold PLP-dependent enzyme [Calditrichaeota bacterium]|nr:aminotransferase class V-fold PLP-dependent enzyme [Calditrichota bacterium]
MDINQFRKAAHEFVDWMADYLENIENYPVKSQVKPGEVIRQLPQQPPENGEDVQEIISDFRSIILPGITHWQSPNFFAYFNANSSYPSVLAEMLTATLGAQCMIWETSPAAAELEELMMEWLKQMMGLPDGWHGVIHDTASAATLIAILSAREKYSGFQVNEQGFRNYENFRVYCSTETHSSIDKAVKIAGIGKANLVKVEVDAELRLRSDALQQAIEQDLAQGKRPLCAIATLGTTGTTAIDPLKEMAEVCQKYDMWLHVDAAHAGTALVLPEYRWMIDGAEMVDSFVFNPHKWMFTNFDCSAYFVKDKGQLIRTFEILPEYLKTQSQGRVNDYRDWGIALGRRFRALKLWFVIRNFGVEGIRKKLRFHLSLARDLKKQIDEHPDFEMMAPLTVNLVCFRYRPAGMAEGETLNALNQRLNQKLNDSGKIYLTHTKVRGQYILRMVMGQTYLTGEHVQKAWQRIQDTTRQIKV